MLTRTHLLVSLFFILVFFDEISNPWIFIPVALFASILPDIDNKFSKIGRKKISRIFNFFMKHRGIIHSFSFLLIVGIFLFFYFRETFYPFIFGYSLHLILDCLTINGLRIFYPLKFKAKGFLRTGGVFENLFFVFLFLVCFFLIFYRIFVVL
ncbi:metal-dependent hydrolase [Candidatus Pacearchaeota archaeon]|jgi:inner membrane protein|nr:metal-dependent hydrolase [Candidatus Pacearchaeota archaeon]